MGSKPQPLSLWVRPGEGFCLKGKNKETPVPVCRKRQRKGFRGQRDENAPIEEFWQA